MKIFIYILSSHLLLNFVILYFFDYLKNRINIFDYPDNKKKLHKNPIPLMGGWIFLFNLILFLILKNWSLSNLETNIIFCSAFFLLIGILDDKYDLSPYSKFLSLTISLILFFNFNESMIINKLEIYDYSIYLNKNIGLFFSVLCVLLFINAFNLFDGINLQSSLYGIYFLLFLVYKSLFIETILVIIIPLLFIIYLNNRNRIFMGDSGTLFLGSIMSLFVIANYTKTNSLKVDEIFLLMFLPGVDMLRLFIQRIMNRKNPFLGDREHLHHYFLELFGYKFSIVSILLISILPQLLNFFIDSKYIITFFILFYLFIFSYLKKKLTNKII
jgi:UDP-GlcNAc:undecaprenyl-phosphate GlcNAc-1-phosphate transferase|tara:strand:- start:3687 stop:4673 length:987 start_codon:yes stop_codon:yes gene_type:complete